VIKASLIFLVHMSELWCGENLISSGIAEICALQLNMGVVMYQFGTVWATIVVGNLVFIDGIMDQRST